jgi:hypothetical protein
MTLSFTIWRATSYLGRFFRLYVIFILTAVIPNESTHDAFSELGRCCERNLWRNWGSPGAMEVNIT